MTATPDTDYVLEEALARDIDLLARAQHHDPFAVLGVHRTPAGTEARSFLPGAEAVTLIAKDGSETSLQSLRDGMFVGAVANDDLAPGQATAYRLRIQWPGGAVQDTHDPYAFGVQLPADGLQALSEGRHPDLDRMLGAHLVEVDGVTGVRFAVWAPNARRVSVVGDFNSWDGRRYPMRVHYGAGVWELFIPGVQAGAAYKFEILGADGQVRAKADPMARQAEVSPATASVVSASEDFTWTDDAWMAGRGPRQNYDAPMSIYEVQAGSWLREVKAGDCIWDALTDRLVPYAVEMGYTHVELMPVMEHPFGGSWGYQPLGMFAPSSRFGSPEAFARFVDACHQAEIGVILDWVPAHFPNDAHGLVQFDGTALYEYQDPREGFHPDWNTMIYNLGRNEVRNFMIASALTWLERFHIDGLRVDAVASMLYRDYSRKAGEWIPNIHGGRENYETIAFLRELNTTVRARVPGAVTIAEESTAWPGVTAPVEQGGLGFHYKWNMGWMHDTLHYVELNPIYRRHHHHSMTFGMVYAHTEHFVLPLSHDEVVHGKGSLIGKMPGDRWQKFANLRAYYGFMWAHPGRKLMFMGGELAQVAEWNHDAEIAWGSLQDPLHAGVQRLMRDLNRTYRQTPALHARDDVQEGFAWVVGDDADNSVFAFLRRGPTGDMLAVSSFTPVVRENYRIGVPHGGRWREVLNTDSASYGGSDVGNSGARHAEEIPAHGHPYSLSLTLPPLATLLLQPEG